MKLPEWRRITKTDHPDMPEWAEKMADAINRQMELLTTLAHGNTTFGDNHLAEIRTVEIPHFPTNGEKVSIALQRLKRNPIGVFILASSFYEFSRMAWRMSPTDPLTVEVKMRWDSAPAKNPTVTLLFLGG